MARRIIRPYLVEFLLENVGKPLTLSQLTKAMPYGTSPETVQSSMRNLIHSGELEITVLARGKSWRLEAVERPEQIEAAPMDELEEENWSPMDEITVVGRLADGTVCVKDGDGRLYRLSPL